MQGYKTDKNFYIQKEKISIIIPNKKNQKKNMINRHQKRKLGYWIYNRKYNKRIANIIQEFQ